LHNQEDNASEGGKRQGYNSPVVTLFHTVHLSKLQYTSVNSSTHQ